ncbi:Autophagy-related protein 13 [Colletotrichum higginsianum IMI 349063]|uniref:Autophagy-related protein 13 n=2 Tax=Colletotrichum higginsianum TaxID=80884 RepID=A0A1B7YF25_COLHI|nr:Autophagy-related protein 13 [Colletotrichum higginsianum IMI 349063]OBR10717.1 Autophagy-related protein 13 [Colletotrichum higginsianum IMI 349063]TID07002.1 Autophagy-related protein 13 [Colletotrichum higginsianum]
MHQQARPAPRVSSPASAPQTNPARTNNPREGILGARDRASSGASGRDSVAPSPTAETPPGAVSADAVKKLDQIIQNFHTKAASLVLQSRMNLKPIYTTRGSGNKKLNKWFQIETEEFDDFKEELRIWRNCGSFENKPLPLIIETYLDTSRLTPSQSLVIVDENGKRWDVMEALNSSDSSDDGRPVPSKRNTEVILERWRIELKTIPTTDLDDFGPTLPTIYKKSIVFFRSLFVATRILPGWKFSQTSLTKGVHPSLEPRCRIRTGEPDTGGLDRLRHPLYDGRPDVVTDYVFGDLEVPVGRFYASVTYRNECNFRVDDSEALLSSRFMGVDENFFQPSLPQRRESTRRNDPEVGSLPSHRRSRNLSDIHQTYGSLSTFHGDGPLGTSPISALKAVRPPGSDTSSPPSSVPTGNVPNPPSSLPVAGLASRPSMKGFGSTGRRPSVSFQPFKAGSLSGSPVPRMLDSESPASPVSRAAALNALTQPRNRTSLTAGMPASLRGGPPPAEAAVVGSPRPSSTSRYSSSFTHRKGRLSFGGASKAGDDEQGSSGRQSLSSSSVAQPGSGLLAEAGGGGSSGSLQTDDDQISDFLKALDSKKTLKSFESGKRGEGATNRTVAQLSRFHLMKESNNALTDSMTSSMQMQRSSSSSSRQLSNVPSMAAPASVSVSSSPGKPLSPHTPHTPAVPSRLSENSIINYNTSQPRSERTNPSAENTQLPREDTITQDGTTAIDIPISPRIGTHPRRSSSVAQQNRAMVDDDDGDLAFAANRSISLGAEDREPPTLSMLLGRQAEAESSARRSGTSLQPVSDVPSSGSADMMRQGSSEGSKPPGGLMAVAPSSSPFGRRRYAGMPSSGGRGQTPPQSSRGSFTGSSGRYGRGEHDLMDEEPLLFDMSEMDAQSRRSLEEGRGGGNVGSGSGSRADFEPRGISRRGW